MTSKEFLNKYPKKAFGEVNVERDLEYPKTGKLNSWGGDEIDYSETAEIKDLGWKFYFNHSCDEWVIGTESEAETFLINLQEALSYAKANQ